MGGGGGIDFVSFSFVFLEPVAMNRMITAQIGCSIWGGRRGDRERGGCGREGECQFYSWCSSAINSY